MPLPAQDKKTAQPGDAENGWKPLRDKRMPLYPGPDEHWVNHGGVTRGVLQEGQQHFASAREAKEWIVLQSQHYPTVYRNDGLVVSFGKDPERRQINVEVWQVLIDGKKPTEVTGSSDSAIELIPPRSNG